MRRTGQQMEQNNGRNDSCHMHLLHYDDYTDKKIIVPNLNEVKNLLTWILVVYALGVMKKATTSSKRKQNSLTKRPSLSE